MFSKTLLNLNMTMSSISPVKFIQNLFHKQSHQSAFSFHPEDDVVEPHEQSQINDQENHTLPSHQPTHFYEPCLLLRSRNHTITDIHQSLVELEQINLSNTFANSSITEPENQKLFSRQTPPQQPHHPEHISQSSLNRSNEALFPHLSNLSSCSTPPSFSAHQTSSLTNIHEALSNTTPTTPSNEHSKEILNKYIKNHQQINLQKNLLESRYSFLQYAANEENEDRVSCSQLKSIDAFFVAVYDGHGGSAVANFASEILHQRVEEALNANKIMYSNYQTPCTNEVDEEDLIVSSLSQAFDNVEQQLLRIARRKNSSRSQNSENSENESSQSELFRRAGSCALSALIKDNKIYAANIGDCKGIICSVEENENDHENHEDQLCVVATRKINHKLNANSKKEQARLKSVFPDEEDIVVCRDNDPQACYVKNILQPTRAFGDFKLKYPEFSGHGASSSSTSQNINNNNYNNNGCSHMFQGPYITHKPDIKVLEIEEKDRFLVMGSDGLWDEVTASDVARVIVEQNFDKDSILNSLFELAFTRAARKCCMMPEELKQIPFGERRNYHDDISIIVVDLQGQVVKKNDEAFSQQGEGFEEEEQFEEYEQEELVGQERVASREQQQGSNFYQNENSTDTSATSNSSGSSFNGSSFSLSTSASSSHFNMGENNVNFQ